MTDYKDHEEAFHMAMREEKEPERVECAVLGAHIFSSLALGGIVKMKNTTGQAEECPCSCGMILSAGNTGIGHKKVWHGFPDLLVNHTAVTVTRRTIDVDESREEYRPSTSKRIRLEKMESVESEYEACNKQNTLYGIDFSAQLISQAITHGFAQRKKYNFVNCLVPTIGFTLNRLLIYLYDPDRDILLRRKDRLELMDQNDCLILPAVVELWFILNLHLFGATMSEQICSKLCKSGLKSHLEEFGGLDIYQQSLLVGAGKNELSQGIQLDANILASKHAFCFVDQ
ncbi:uncharacterized protein LOC123564747 isoform X2 [Mercenaria mercenaria]|uniref:uncharacterized protein LOC123564747 isoform X2 n=1 Tax=Mercenaria mercenaria TaxID=6596 RepID=UPI00234E3AF6|nr:uncharacterized protein LOC123564747 isoform X2 [Mercenaria mercenaria]